METLKTLIHSKFRTLSLVAVTLLFSVILLMVRMKLNKSYFYLFLVWNAFLAVIPYAITMYLNTKPNLNRLKLGFWFIVWLLFLPNSPYIITDLIHIKVGNNLMPWLDVIVVLSFALSGLFLFYLSIIDMQKLISKHFKRISINMVTLTILFLCSFGVYLGRFLRYNSWEVISAPQDLFLDIINIFILPFQNSEAWLFTIGFGGFLVIGYWVFTALNSQKIK